METEIKTSSEGLINPEMLNSNKEFNKTNESKKIIKRNDGLFERKNSQVVTEDGKQLLL